MHVWCKIFHLVSSICTSFLWRSRQNDFIFHSRRCAFYVPIFRSIFQSKKKKKKKTYRPYFFFLSQLMYKKKRNKRIEISTPSSRYLLQKQVQSCDIIQPKRILFFEMNIIETRLLWGYAKCIRIFVRYLYVIGEFYFIQTVE